MMKIIVIGIFYNLLLQNNAAGEPAVKVRLCSDMFSNVITKYQNQMDEDECKKHIGHFARYKNWMEFVFGKPSIWITITSIQLGNSKGCQILSSSSLETTIEATIIYGEKSSSQNGKGKSKNRNNYLMLNIIIDVILTIEVTGNSLNFSVQDCGCYPKTVESNLNENPDLNLQEVRRLESRSCSMVGKMIANMNVHWKDCFSIDPSGGSTLLHKYSVQNNDCVELNLGLCVDNSEVLSEQTHADLSGSCISILIECLVAMMSNDVSMIIYKFWEDMRLSRDEINKLFMYEVAETDYTTVKIRIRELIIYHKNNTMAVRTHCQGFGQESESEGKSIFEVQFVVKFIISSIVDQKNVWSQCLLYGDPEILMSESHMGDDPALDPECVEALIEKVIELLKLAVSDSQKVYGMPMQNLVLDSSVSNTLTAYEIQLSTPKTPQND